jgi:low affinity Fe/Cu permease
MSPTAWNSRTYEALLLTNGLRMKNKSDDRNHRAPAAPSPTLTQQFSQFAHATSAWTGNPTAFLLAVAVVIVWVVTGPFFHYSDTWQLVINTGTTIVTFLMVFLIQNTQNRDTLAIQLKLSELVLAMKGAKNEFAAIEDLNDEELQSLHEECRSRAEMTLDHLERRKTSTPGNSRRSRPAAHRTTVATRKSS